MAAHQFTIPVGELDAGGKRYVFPIPAAWVRGALEDCEATTGGTEGTLDVRASKSGNDVVVHGTIQADLVAPCARCLEPAKIRVDHPLSVLMVPAHTAGARRPRKGAADDELSADEVDVLPYAGETIVLDDLVRDELVLDIPMIPLCSEDCPGMSPPPEAQEPKGAGARAERPVDPRLLPLKRMKAKAKE